MINNCYTFKELKEKFGWTTTEGSIKDQIRYARKRNVNIEVAFKEGPTYFKILNLDEANFQNNELWVTYPRDPKFEVTKSGKVRNAITLALVGHKTENGYLVVTNSENKDYRIHRMVMETFYPRPDSDNLIVDHINGDKTNNSIENLRWATQAENCCYRDENWNKISENVALMIKKYGYDGFNNIMQSILKVAE